MQCVDTFNLSRLAFLKLICAHTSVCVCVYVCVRVCGSAPSQKIKTMMPLHTPTDPHNMEKMLEGQFQDSLWTEVTACTPESEKPRFIPNSTSSVA